MVLYNNMKNYAKYQVSLKILLRKEDCILILKDSDGVIDLPGGRIDVKEARGPFLSVIEREVSEELGENMKYELGPHVMTFVRHLSEQKEPVLILVFEANYIKGNVFLSDEHKLYEWINPSKENFSRKDFYSNDEYHLFLEYFKKIKLKCNER